MFVNYKNKCSHRQGGFSIECSANNQSWISEVKLICNIDTRKKRVSHLTMVIKKYRINRITDKFDTRLVCEKLYFITMKFQKYMINYKNKILHLKEQTK